MKILLDYFFPITTIEATASASTAFLKQVCIVVNPNVGGTAGDVTLCTSMAEVGVVTDNTEAQQLFDAGMNRVYVMQSADLDIATTLASHGSKFFTLLISSDFSDANVTADLDIGSFTGVVGLSSDDDDFLDDHAAIENRVAFHSTTGNKAKNMFYAFGKLLSNSLSWMNQQYITMPVADDVDELGEANNLYDLNISFVLSDDEFGNRLGLFATGGKAIIAPYVKRNLEIDLQSAALTYVSGNQPTYTNTHAALMEDELQKVVDSYISRGWIETGTTDVKLEQDNFVASGYFTVSDPNALWRIFGQITQATS